MSAKQNNEDIKQNITESEKQNATGAGSVTEGDKHLVETKTVKHPLDANIMVAIQCANFLMNVDGNDAMWPDDVDWQMWNHLDCDSRDYGEEECYASDANVAEQDDHDGMMRELHERESYDWHPYFNNPNASEYNPDAK